ncbi:MAG: small-conductance mechanosensitive ion channel [Parcubacteria group bacterium Gr01-1014_73]|nr:MAG: small-conductance mechanosensitive ion channel [Parcubacteria group bacterium Gr01-1014_73]
MLATSFQDVWLGVAGFLPKLIVAFVIVVVGWIVGAVLRQAITHLFRILRVDSVLKQAKVEQVVNKAGFTLNSGRFIGGLVEWFVIVVFLVAAFDVMGLNQVNAFLQQVVLLYLPQVIVASLILLVAAVIAEAMQKVIVGSAKAVGVKFAHLAGTITRWAIWGFAVLAALFQLGIAAAFIQTLFTGVVVALALALGLAFGLGGQEAAARYIEKIRQEIGAHHNQ